MGIVAPFLVAVLMALSLVPLDWNKFDLIRNTHLLYSIGILLPIIFLFSVKRIRNRFASSWFEIFCLTMYFVLVTMSFFNSPVADYAFGELIVTGIGIALYFLAQTWNAKERSFFSIILLWFTLISMGVAIFGYLHFSETRVAGLFFDLAHKAFYWPNAYALFLLMTWPLAAYYLPGKSSFSRVVKACCLALIFTVLVLTFSRGAILTCVGQLFVMLLIYRRRVFSQWKMIVSIGVLTVALTFGLHALRSASLPSNSFLGKAQFSGTELDTSVVERAEFMQGSVTLIKRNPLFGNGLSSFRSLYPGIQPESIASSDHPHNWYLKIALESGIPAMVFFILFLLSVFWSKRREIFGMGAGTDMGSASVAYTTALLGALAHQLIDFNMNFLTNMLLFWLLLAGLRQARNDEHRAETGTGRVRVLHLLVHRSGVAVVTIFVVIVSGALVRQAFLDHSLPSHPEFIDQSWYVRGYWFDRAIRERDAGQLPESLASIGHQIAHNAYDSYAWNFRGKILEQLNRLDSARITYKRAVILNPLNEFCFYTDWLNVAKRMGTSVESELATKEGADGKSMHDVATFFLKDYTPKVAQNVHYTAQTGNPQCAADLAGMMGDTATQRTILDARDAWRKEVKKEK